MIVINMPRHSPGRAVTGVFFGVLLLLAYQGSSADRLEALIVDDESGQPAAATVLATDAGGRSIEIDGKHAHVEYLGKRRCYVDGKFALAGGTDRLKIEIRRGLETRPLLAEVDLAKRESAPLAFRLKRWVNMRERSYLSGDTHVHFLSTAESHLQMRAEDLNILNLLVSDFTKDREKFTGKLDRVSTPEHSVFVGQESRDWQQGHVILLGIRRIVEPFEPFGGKFQNRDEPNLLMANILRDAREQGGVTTWAHFCNLPGAESPIDIALGLVDAVDLITYDDPTQLPSHWGPWTNSGMPQGEFTVMRSLDLYYQYLNAGFRLPIGAGTDKMGDNIPVGSNRLYVPVTGEPTYEKWLAGLKAGTGFVTNGPMLTFEVEGHRSGETVPFKGVRKVRARASAQSLLPFQSVEIVVNGETAAIKNIPAGSRPGPDALYSVELDTTIELDRSSWVAARIADSPANRNRILPRGLTVFAHSNPIYFLKDGSKVRELSSVRYLEKYTRGTIHWLKTAARFRSPAEKQEALRLADQARRFYADLEK
jgi:hypothetical protein